MAGQGTVLRDPAAAIEQVLFLFNNRSKLSVDIRKELHHKLWLRLTNDEYSRAGQIWVPLTRDGPVPLALEGDLVAAGARFLHAQYQQLWEEEEPGIDFRLWLAAVGVKELSVAAAAARLMRLYATDGPSEGRVSLEQHMQHLDFLALHYSELKQDSSASTLLQTSLRLYGEEQIPETEAPAFKPEKLCWPVMWGVGEGTKQQLRQCGVVFLHPGCYTGDKLKAESSAVKDFLIDIAGVQDWGADEVSINVDKLNAGAMPVIPW